MPTLLSFRDRGGELRGVVGLRAAVPQPLYLEQYLEQPIETAIATATGDAGPARAGRRGGQPRRRQLPRGHAHGGAAARRSCWRATIAGSCSPRPAPCAGSCEGFGAPLVELARADGARVASSPDRWGRYYEKDPRVLAGYLPASRRIPGFSHAVHDR